ncbi:hypothetical protein V8E54_012084 [Elaphomyces granulatus]
MTQMIQTVTQQGDPVRLGMGSITLPLNTTTATAPSLTSMKRNGLLATFSLHVSQTFSKAELKDPVTWLTNMPKSETAALKLENVNPFHIKQRAIFSCNPPRS